MKKILTTLLLTATLISCGDKKFEIQKTELNKSNENFEVAATYPTVKGEVSENVSRAFSDIESSIKQYAQMLETESSNITPTAPYTMKTNYEVFENKNLGVTSVLIDASLYAGGAHAEPTKVAVNIDNKTKDEYKLDNVISAEKKQAILDKINAAIDNKQKFDGSAFDTFGMHVDDFSSLNFYFKDDKAIAFFDPAVIAPYSEGFIEFAFNADELK